MKALFNQLKAGGLAKNKHSLDHQNAIYPHMFQSSQRIRSIQDAENDDHDMTDDSAPPPRRRSIMRG